ncbi:CDP-glucose 4,6-dehydratase [Flavobacteriaceae bacterium]|nr:CDP-glucose 4,6-dehydratase [Flavobacteriaceae bacterium]
MDKKKFISKKVLITGNTGFKGSWLTLWLLKMGARVIGYSKGIPTEPSLFKILNLEKDIIQHYDHVEDLNKLRKVVIDEKPDFIFHLAAQPIVSVSYEDPLGTFMSNSLGTLNVLEIIRHIDFECKIVMITSDKSYDNLESLWGYKETDNLGGKDTYSGSKAAAEMMIKSYFHSFLRNKKNIKISVTRAGNVIGGGDWAKDRILVDCFKSWSNKSPVIIRAPHSTRPWQHVLEPLSGYLKTAIKLDENINGEVFNFGPVSTEGSTVLDLVSKIYSYWSATKLNEFYKIESTNNFDESKLLKLNCEKAYHLLNWKPTLNYEKTVSFVGEWYSNFYNGQINMIDYTEKQIELYEKLSLK